MHLHSGILLLKRTVHLAKNTDESQVKGGRFRSLGLRLFHVKYTTENIMRENTSMVMNT